MKHTVPHINISGGNFIGTIVEDVPGDEILGAGFRPLNYKPFPKQNLYRDFAVGLNFEHIMNGVAADREINKFTPRLDPRSVVSHSHNEASIINRAEDSTWRIESEMRYVITEENAIDMTFTVCLHEDRFPLGYAAFMWASYMNRTRERRIYFYGEQDGETGWTSFGDMTSDTPEGFETGTVSAVGVSDLPYEDGADTLNVLEHPDKKFSRPFYYGLADGDGDLKTIDDTMVYIMMFDQVDPIRFAMWNFIRNENNEPDTHSPAWDWQYVIRNPIIGRTYGYRARMMYKPYISREDVVDEYERWNERNAQHSIESIP